MVISFHEELGGSIWMRDNLGDRKWMEDREIRAQILMKDDIQLLNFKG